MNVRRALTFAWRMAFAYLRIALSRTLIIASIIGLAVLALLGSTLIWRILDEMDGVADVFRFIIQTTAFVAIIFCVFFSIGLIWNIIGVAIGMLFEPRELSVRNLRITIPGKMQLYNNLGLPLFVMIWTLVLNFPLETTMSLGLFMFLISLLTGAVARNSWRNVVDWYELQGRFVKNIKKKKNIPKIETTQTDAADMVVAEDDTARVRKSR